jgi:uncharacterized protein YsxB (DUF464 family)
MYITVCAAYGSALAVVLLGHDNHDLGRGTDCYATSYPHGHGVVCSRVSYILMRALTHSVIEDCMMYRIMASPVQ